MELSLFLAKVIGLIFMLVSAALLFNKKNIDLLFKIYSRREAVFLTGFLETVLGLVFVFNHNIWEWNFRGIITFIGWMLLFRGLGRIFFPKITINLIASLRKAKAAITPILFVIFLIGLYLVYMGFTA